MKILISILLLLSISSIISCGTAKGILVGTGSVLEGAASDLRGIGSILNWLIWTLNQLYQDFLQFAYLPVDNLWHAHNQIFHP